MELINMRRTASEVLHELEMRIARLEQGGSLNPFFADLAKKTQAFLEKEVSKLLKERVDTDIVFPSSSRELKHNKSSASITVINGNLAVIFDLFQTGTRYGFRIINADTDKVVYDESRGEVGSKFLKKVAGFTKHIAEMLYVEPIAEEESNERNKMHYYVEEDYDEDDDDDDVQRRRRASLERFSDEMWADELEADEMFAGRTWDGKGDQKNYNKPPAPKNQPDCYSDDNWEGVGKPGEGETCYRLHNPYGSGVSKNKKEYNKRYREEWMDSPSIKRAPEERPGRR